MPRVVNPNSVEYSVAGRVKKLQAVTDDIKGTTRNTLFNLIVGAGGMIVNGISQFLAAITVTGSITASTTITAGTSLNGATLATTSDATIGGLIRSVNTYSNPITSSYRAVYVTSVDGQFGFNLSSREFKQDIANLVLDPATVLQLQAVTFRYIAAVELEGDAAETQIGFIAEDVHDLGLEWLVEYDNGKPCGIKLHLIAFALLIVAQDHETRLAALEGAQSSR